MTKEFYKSVLRAADKMLANSSTEVEKEFWENVLKNVSTKGF